MERADRIRDTGNHLMRTVLLNSLQDLMTQYKCGEKKYLEEFSGILQQLIDLTVKRQKEGTKGRVCCLGICYCRSSVFTDIHEMKLDTYGEEIYLDEEECSLFWKPDFIFDFYKRDMEYFRTNIRKEIPRVRTWEIQQYGTGYWINYIYILSEFLRQKLPDIMRGIFLEGLQTDGKLRIFFGEYMGRGAVLYEEEHYEVFSDKQ